MINAAARRAASSASSGFRDFSNRRLASVPDSVQRATASNRRLLEVGRFEQHGRGGVGDFRVGAAHDAGQRDGALCVGDHQVLGLQFKLRSVQEFESLSRLRPAHDDPMLAQHLVVEGVQRLTPLDHDVVGHVDDVVDRAHSGRDQRFLHPLWGGANSDAVDHDGGVPRTAFGVLDRHTRAIGDRRVRFCVAHWRLGGDAAVQRRNLTSDPQNREVIGTIRRRLDVEHDIGQDIGERRAQRRIGLEHEYPLMLIGESQFAFRADHAHRSDAADFSAAELA